MQNSIRKDVLEIIGLILKTSVNMKTARASNPNWDSLSHMELIFTLEDRFSLEFPEEKIGELDTVKKIVEFIEDGRQ